MADGEVDEKSNNCSLSSGDELDETDNPDSESWSISLRHGTLSKQLKGLEYFTANGLHQAFQELDPKNTGKVAKTQLQILCINLCTVLGVPFSPENIMKFMEETKELKFQDFLVYIGSNLLHKSKIFMTFEITKMFQQRSIRLLGKFQDIFPQLASLFQSGILTRKPVKTNNP